MLNARTGGASLASPSKDGGLLAELCCVSRRKPPQQKKEYENLREALQKKKEEVAALQAQCDTFSKNEARVREIRRETELGDERRVVCEVRWPLPLRVRQGEEDIALYLAQTREQQLCDGRVAAVGREVQWGVTVLVARSRARALGEQ